MRLGKCVVTCFLLSDPLLDTISAHVTVIGVTEFGDFGGMGFLHELGGLDAGKTKPIFLSLI